MRDLYKYFEKLTPSQVLKQGYTRCVEEGGEVAYNIIDCMEDGIMDGQYIVCEKRPRPAYQFKVGHFRAMLYEYLENQDEDTFACMENFEKLIEKESFAEIIHLLNEKLSSVKFWPCTDIVLIDEPKQTEK